MDKKTRNKDINVATPCNIKWSEQILVKRFLFDDNFENFSLFQLVEKIIDFYHFVLFISTFVNIK